MDSVIERNDQAPRVSFLALGVIFVKHIDFLGLIFLNGNADRILPVSQDSGETQEAAWKHLPGQGGLFSWAPGRCLHFAYDVSCD